MCLIPSFQAYSVSLLPYGRDFTSVVFETSRSNDSLLLFFSSGCDRRESQPRSFCCRWDVNHWVSLHDVWGSTTFVSRGVNDRSYRVSVLCYSSNMLPGAGAPLKWFESLLFAGLEFEDLFGTNVLFLLYFWEWCKMLLLFQKGGSDMPLILIKGSFPHFLKLLFTVKHMLSHLDKVGSWWFSQRHRSTKLNLDLLKSKPTPSSLGQPSFRHPSTCSTAPNLSPLNFPGS